jgi:hypothetical protein
MWKVQTNHGALASERSLAHPHHSEGDQDWQEKDFLDNWFKGTVSKDILDLLVTSSLQQYPAGFLPFKKAPTSIFVYKNTVSAVNIKSMERDEKNKIHTWKNLCGFIGDQFYMQKDVGSIIGMWGVGNHPVHIRFKKD